MLKALWRKTTGQEANAPQEEQSDGFKLTEQLPHTAHYHLERLQTLVELRFRKTFSGSRDNAIRDLIHYSSRIQDQDIQRELLLLYLNCPPNVQEYLRSGNIIDASHYIHRQVDNTNL